MNNPNYCSCDNSRCCCQPKCNDNYQSNYNSYSGDNKPYEDHQKMSVNNGMSKQSCSVNSHYPTCNDVERNSEAIRLLLEDYASAHSELSAITSYMYQSAILEDSYPEIASPLSCIGIVEMKHLELLAAAIIALGGDPQYFSEINQSGEYEYWTGAFADYSKFVRDILLNDIAAEQGAIAQYIRHAEVIPIPCVQALLCRIVKDEQLHVRILTEILNGL